MICTFGMMVLKLKLVFEILERHKAEVATNNPQGSDIIIPTRVVLKNVQASTQIYWTEIQSNCLICLTGLSTDQ